MQKDGKIRWPRLLLVVPGIFALALLIFGGRSLWKKTAEPPVPGTFSARKILMDTLVEVRVDGPDAPKFVELAFQEMERLEKILSRFLKESEVAKINQEAGHWVLLSTAAFEVIELALEVAEISGGAFDPTIGAVADLWGFASENPQVPEAEKLGAALASVDYRQVELDFQERKVRLPRGTVLDLGGIAKGYIVDQAARLLRERGVQHAIINAGGDLAVLGSRPDGSPWRVGVQDPLEPSTIRWVLPLDDNTVVTSGDYQRYFLQDGQRWHHILDPQTGFPARGLHSVSVVTKEAAYGDALSTAIFVLGLDLGRELVESLPGVEAILVGETQTWLSPGLTLQETFFSDPGAGALQKNW